MVSETLVGFVIAAASAFFNGSFPAWQKIVKEDVDSVVFNGLVGLGACVSSLLVPLIWGKAYVFSVAAMLGGVLFVFATLCTFIAIPKVGLGVACATWSCTAIIVSFLWGVVGPEQVRSPMKNLGLSMLSLLCLVVGALIIVSADSLAKRFSAGSEKTAPLAQEQNGRADLEQNSAETPEAQKQPAAQLGDRLVGVLFAVATGVFGGSVLVPMKFIPASVDPISAVMPFGVGAGVASSITTLLYFKAVARKPGFPCVSGRTLLAGLLAGTTWNAGNVCQIVAQSAPILLPYGIAYPVNQCGVLFAGLWGIFVFREIQGRAVAVFWAGAALLVSGVVLLGLFGPGA